MVREMPAFEGADLDVVKTEPDHEGYVKKFTRTVSTNEPSEITERSVGFVDNIARSPTQNPNLTMSEIFN